MVRSNCPSSCGICCADDSTFLFVTESDDVPKQGCEWIAKRPSKRQEYCTIRGDSKLIAASCQQTCDNCQVLVESPSDDEPAVDDD